MGEDQNRKEYCDAMDKIHAPEHLQGKVKAMNRQSKIKSFKLRKLAYVAAALGVVFVSSNAVTYAATGSTWIGKVMVTINGEEKEMDAEYFNYTRDGVEYEGIELHVDEDEASSMSVEFSDEQLEDMK